MYARTGQRAGIGRLARGANYVPHLGRRRRLGQLDWGSLATAPDDTSSVILPTTPPAPGWQPNWGTSIPGSSTSPGSSTPGWTPAQEAAVITSGINAAGAIGVRAVSPTPSVTYNPATGQYVATGGASLPGGLALGTSLTGLFTNPLVLIALVAGVVLVSRR